MIIPPWSYSALDCFDNCPRMYKWRYILKNKSPDTTATKNGTEVHLALEERVRDNRKLPMPLVGFEPLAASVAQLKHKADVRVEQAVALDEKMAPCGFFDKNVWGRGKIDLLAVQNDKAWIGDWKTGKVREKPFQVSVFAAFVFKIFPQINAITANNLWLNVGKVGQKYSFLRENLDLLWSEILRKIYAVEDCARRDNFPEKPSGLCGYCNDTTCKFNKGK